jgi:hypothetical protein
VAKPNVERFLFKDGEEIHKAWQKGSVRQATLYVGESLLARPGINSTAVKSDIPLKKPLRNNSRNERWEERDNRGHLSTLVLKGADHQFESLWRGLSKIEKLES